MPTFLLTQGISNLPHHMVMLREEMAFDDTASYTQWEMGYSTVKCYCSDWDLYPCLQGHLPRAQTN